tara:strand:+ start:580 stop:768 length:189 start_codon:yes stop_codon:yes gene_type:complete
MKAVYKKVAIGNFFKNCHTCVFVKLSGHDLLCKRKKFPKQLPKGRKVDWRGSCEYWEDGVPF